MLSELIITDITRMGGNFICVAGIDPNGKTIRPLYKDKRIDQDWCCVEGCEIRPFTRIMIDLETPRPLPPHTEDYHIGPEKLKILGDCSIDEKLNLLKRNCSKDVASIFGADIQRVTGEGTFIQLNTGNYSLGTVNAKKVFGFKHILYDDHWDYRINFIDTEGNEYRLKAVDLTFQTYVDHLRICHKLSIDEIEGYVNRNIFALNDIYLRIGLSRGWGKYPDRCYLQITGIFTFPDYLENLSFQAYQREIETANPQQGVHEDKGSYPGGPNDLDIPF
jgi:hypothetical protein